MGLALVFTWVTGCDSAREDPTVPLAVNVPVPVRSDTIPAQQIRSYLANALGFSSQGGRVVCSYSVLGVEESALYLWALCEELMPGADSVTSGSGSSGPVALTLDSANRPPRIAAHTVPRDGGRYSADLDRSFPEAVRRRLDEAARGAADLRRANRQTPL